MKSWEITCFKVTSCYIESDVIVHLQGAQDIETPNRCPAIGSTVSEIMQSLEVPLGNI